MPTYDYLCQACQHRFELFQSMTEATKKKCPACGKQKLQRLIGAGAAILFKGSGFYQTDYRSSSYTEGAKKDAGTDGAKPEPAAAGKPDAAQPAADGGKSGGPAAAKPDATAGSKSGKPAASRTAKKPEPER